MSNYDQSRISHEAGLELVTPGSLEELYGILQESGVPVDTWKPEAGSKTVHQLYNELASGESTLVRIGASESEGLPTIERQTSVVWIDVYGNDSQGRRWHLREDHQEFSDGRPPRSRKTLLASLAEKAQAGEDIHEAAARALHEELAIEQQLPVVFRATEHLPVEFSRSYPGLPARSAAHFFDVELPSDLFRPEGYAVPEHDKITYFVWEPASSGPDHQGIDLQIEATGSAA